MPRINRLRVNNINYNDGTQRYDDFSMSFYGKNGLYDLINGGGKSILLLMIMQTVLPNQELDKKQPVSKLFKSSNNNTAIHSMVEWKLDKATSSHWKADYLLCGFCAKGGTEGKGEVEYFNYAITYSNYNDYDIINFPLVQGNEKIGYSGLRKKLIELKNIDLLNCKVHLFDTNEAYKRFLGQFGIYESHWNIIKGINVSEGRVRTYIEENYRTTRKLVDKLLIEEIIDKANGMRMSGEDSSSELSRSLLDIENKMLELSNKKKEITSYEYQIQSLDGFIEKLTDYSEVIKEEESFWIKYNQLLHQLSYCLEKQNASQLEKQGQLDEVSKEYDYIKQYIEFLNIEKVKRRLTNKKKETTTLHKELTNCNSLCMEVEKELKLYEGLRYYKELKELQKKYNQIQYDMNHSTGDKEEILEKIYKLTATMKLHIEHKKENLSKELEEISRELILIKENTRSLKLEYDNLTKYLNQNDLLLTMKKEERDKLYVIIEEVNGKIRDKSNMIDDIVTIQSDEELCELYTLKKCEKMKELESIQTEYDMVERRIAEANTDTKILTETIGYFKEKEKNLSKELELYDTKVEKVLQLKKILQLENSVSNEYILSFVTSKENEDRKLLFLKQQELEVIERKITGLQDGTSFIESSEQMKVYLHLKELWNDIQLGSEYIRTLNELERQIVLSKIPFLPYGILVNKEILQDIKHKLKFDWMELSHMVPIIALEELEQTSIDMKGIYFIQKDVQISYDDATIEKERIQLEVNKSKYVKDIRLLQDNLSFYKSTYDEVMNYHKNVSGLMEKVSKDLNHCKQEIQKNLRKQQQCEKDMADGDIILQKHLINKSEFETKIQVYEELIQLLTIRMKHSESLDKVLSEISSYEYNEKVGKEQLHKIVTKSDTLEESQRLLCKKQGDIETIRANIEHKWSTRYKVYDGVDSTKSQSINILDSNMEEVEQELDLILSSFEHEYSDMKQKNELLELLQTSMNQNLYEIEIRGYSIDILKEKAMAYSTTHEDTVTILRTKQTKLSQEYALLEKEYYTYKSQYDIESGKFERMLEIYNRYKKFDIESLSEEVDLDNCLKECNHKADELKDILKKIEHVLMELSKEIVLLERTIEKGKQTLTSNNRRVSIEDISYHILNVYEYSKELDAMNNSVMTLQKRALERLKRCQEAKQKCVSDISIHNPAYGQEINGVYLEESYDGVQQLIDSLMRSKEYFEEEIKYIEQGLHEIIEIKDRFKNRCLQESKQIKADLEKFTKYSKMVMDNEVIESVKLKIYYLPEDVQKSKMEKYIDKIVADASGIQSEDEKKKLLKDKLSSKSLFGVIVNEVNGMELSLYKRERIKENSRHLPFEEAVGSTGQSQGIYILLIIAIINYIQRMYSNEVDDNELTKTIFIDNPFGAAKDVYIWEPILSMLKENNVQLIVPTRGVSPAMTSKFDVYYTLGQEMKGNKLQTVVANYRSDVTIDEVEYVKLQGEQLSLLLS